MNLTDLISIIGIVVGVVQIAQSLPTIWKAYRGKKRGAEADEDKRDTGDDGR